MKHFSLYCIVLIVLCLIQIEAFPQDNGRILFNLFSGAQQIPYRQGSIDEFLALRPSTPNPNDKEPCIPHQFHPRNKRSPHFNKNMLRPLYPVNIYEQNIHNIVPIVNSAKPPYNNYGGYYCGNHKPQRPIQQPVHNNFWSHFSNIFGGVFGPNANVISAAPTAVGNDVRPVHEDNDHDNNPNEVRKIKNQLR